MSRAICGTEVTIDHIQEVLRERFATQNTIVKHEASEIGIMKGFASKICQLKLTWESGETSLPTSLVAKIPSTDNATKMLGDWAKDEQEKAIFLAAQIDRIERVIAQHLPSMLQGLMSHCYFSRQHVARRASTRFSLARSRQCPWPSATVW